jgi:hypothetical protein
MSNKRRDAAKERRWRDLLKQFARSGLSVRAFCQREQLAEPAFFAWRRTIERRDAEANRSRRATFLPVVVNENHRGQQAITIELAGGHVLRLPESMSTQRLVELVSALETQAAR